MSGIAPGKLPFSTKKKWYWEIPWSSNPCSQESCFSRNWPSWKFDPTFHWTFESISCPASAQPKKQNTHSNNISEFLWGISPKKKEKKTSSHDGKRFPPSSRGFGAYRAGAVFGGTSWVLASAKEKTLGFGEETTMVYGITGMNKRKQCYDSACSFFSPKNKRNKQKEGWALKTKKRWERFSFWMWIDILIKGGPESILYIYPPGN